MTAPRPAADQSRRNAKAAFRCGCAAAALLSTVGLIAPAHAQIGGNGMIVENIPHMPPGTMIVENIPHMPPGTMIVENIPHMPSGTMIVENIPHATAPIFIAPTPFATPATAAGQGTPVFSSGTGSIVQTAARDTITINSAQAIIDWSLFDTGIGGGDINFLNAGTELLFTSAADYTVLNRIIPTDQSRAIRFDGTVTSQISGVSGGNIWFYSPGGIVVGADGIFDVGSLVLTTNDIDTSGGSLFGSDGEIRFRGAANSTSAVVIESGAQLNATNNGSYLALVAPRVIQSGAVDVDGSVAYVAAEQADLTINNGLFDITVTVGTTDENGVVHNGTTTGQSSTGALDTQAVYMVAIPKNDAITMLIGGDIGYRPASSATIENGRVVLSAGADIVAGDINRDAATISSASIDFTGGTLNADTTAFATEAISAMLTNGQTLTVASGTTLYDLNLEARDRVDFGGIFGGGISVDGNVSIVSGGSQSIGDVNIATGGTSTTSFSSASTASATGGIRIAGALNIDVSSNANTGGTGIGGNVTFDLNGGRFTADSLNISADGIGRNSGSSAISPLHLSAFAMGLAPLPPASSADGGDGVGGDIVFNLDLGAGSSTVANMSVSADGFGGSGDPGDANLSTVSGNGGSGTGGNATFNALSGTLTVTNTLTISATGTGGSGGFGSGVAGGNGGAAIGGSATFNVDGTASIGTNTTIVSSNAIGGAGGGSGVTFDALGAEIPSDIGGIGGDATGGTSIYNDTAGTHDFGSITVSADATGGTGGTNSGVTIGDARADGGRGGNAFGGTATINLNQASVGSPTYTASANAVGGVGGAGLNGGNGGTALGGIAAINVDDVQVQFDDPTIRAIATGGNGGFSDGPGGLGGNGGNANGGAARLQVSGLNGLVPVDFIILQSDGLGGDGGAGGSTAFGLGGTAGDGGNGGSGAGGSSEFVARTGGTLTITGGFVVSSTGQGGTGGLGGDIDMLGGGVAGDGGDGGDGTGGSPLLLAQGGTITANDIILFGNGVGGDGGTGGTDLIVQLGADGDGGDGIGGNPIIEIQEGSPGIVTLGATFMVADGAGGAGTTGGTSFGGRIDIIDTSTDPAGLITMDSLTAQALASASSPTSGFYMTGDSGPIAVAGDVTIDVGGNAEFAFDGTGQLTVGGNMTVTSGADILVSHTNNNAPTISIDVTGEFLATADSDFDSMAGSIVQAGDRLFVRALTGNIFAADLRSQLAIVLAAGQNVVLNDAAVTGPPVLTTVGTDVFVTNGIGINAGLDPVTFNFDPNFNATFTGDITSTGGFRALVGGSIIFQTGTNVVSDNIFAVVAGDDIIVQSGASITAGNNPATTLDPLDPFSNVNNLILIAGNGASPILIAPPLTPIGSIVLRGDVNANGFAVVMSAAAIDGLGGNISANSISADIINAPANGVIQRDDNGLLSAMCVEGNVCLGTISANNIVQIGQDNIILLGPQSDVIQATIEGGAVVADTIRITTRRDLIIGTDGIASSFDGASEVLLDSLEGNVDLRSASLTSDLILINAAGSLLGSGSISSTNDVGITVGQDLFAASIDAGGELTQVADVGGALENFYSVPGSIIVGTLSIGATGANIDASGDISFDQVNVASGNDIILLAGGDAFLGGTSGAANILIDAQNVEIGSIVADDLIDIFAVGDIFGSDVFGGGDITLNAGGSIDLIALSGVGSITAEGTDGFEVDTLSAGNDTALRSLNGAVIVNIDTAVSGNLIASGAAILLNAINDLAVTDARATNGDIDIIAGGNLTVSQALSVGNIALTSTDASVSAGNLEAGLVTVAPAMAGSGGGLVPLGRTVGSPGVGDITITAAVDAIITNDALANNDLFIIAGGLIDIQALATGVTISTDSADLDIGTSGQLGESDFTQSIDIVSNGTNQMVLGGTGTTGTFSLDADEFTRIFSGGDLTIFAIATLGTNPSMIIEDLNAQVATGSGGPQDGNIGTTGTLTLATEGDMRVNGGFFLNGATANNTLALFADQNMRVDASSATIAVFDANGGLSGQLNLFAQSIIAATDSAASDIASATLIDVDARLANNDGINRDDGFFMADGISFAVETGLFIQNIATGTGFDDRRGFVVGDGGLSIVSSASGNTIDIVINGIQQLSNGTTITGIDMISQTAISAIFDTVSTINGCQIIAPAICRTSLTPHTPNEDDLDPDNFDAQPPTTPLIETVDIFPNREGPIIDDPVTGAGNEDLWIRNPVGGGNDD